ncbi:MAG: AMP-binding protein [Pseudomonadota bacterium]
MTYAEKPWLKSYGPDVFREIVPPEETFVERFREVARRAGDSPALFFLGKTFTYAELDDFSNRFAQALLSRGLGRGDVVGVCLPNTPQYTIGLLGILKAGAAVSNVSPLLTAHEMAYQLNDCGAKALVLADMLLEKPFQAAAKQTPNLETVIVTGLMDLTQPPAGPAAPGPAGGLTPFFDKEIVGFKAFLAEFPGRDPEINPGLDDAALIQYTGGTTGPPKGAVLTHRNLISNMEQFRAVLRLERGRDSFCAGLPMFHIAGLVVSLLGPFFGIPQVVIPDPRNTKFILNQIAAYKPSVLVNVPTLYLMFLQDPVARQIDWSAVRVCYSGAAPFSDEGIRALESLIGPGKVRELYGMTETSPLIAMDQPGAPKMVGSVGLPMPSTKLRLVDPVEGRGDVAIGEVGEILVSGPQVMRGYHNKPEENALAFVELDGDRWLRTGDVGRLDQAGFLYLVDRSKDMIIVGGYKVFSTEVENVLSEHPAIGMCAVVGIPNPERPETEMVKLVVQRSRDYAAKPEEEVEAAVLAFAREKLAPYKVPKVLEFKDMPLTAVGKIDKKQLR